MLITVTINVYLIRGLRFLQVSLTCDDEMMRERERERE